MPSVLLVSALLPVVSRDVLLTDGYVGAQLPAEREEKIHGLPADSKHESRMIGEED